MDESDLPPEYDQRTLIPTLKDPLAVARPVTLFLSPVSSLNPGRTPLQYRSSGLSNKDLVMGYRGLLNPILRQVVVVPIPLAFRPHLTAGPRRRRLIAIPAS